VADAVEAMTRLMATEAAWGQVVNIGNDTEETPIEDLVAMILRTARVRPVVERRPAPPGSVPRRCPDIGRLRALTGFAPKVSLESGVAETFAWYREWWQREERPR
jgi:UDP-glucose 4-epimerase/UDP-glucuronate decarboxylase